MAPKKELTTEALEMLRIDLKAMAQPGGTMEHDAFRYDMFAKRLNAAEYGRQDAVEWALEWHAGLLKDKAEQQAAKQQSLSEEMARQAFDQNELAAGRCSNPRYQAYLDTVDDLSDRLMNVGYMAFINERSSEYRRKCPEKYQGLVQPPGFVDEFTQFIREYADSHLSERVLRLRMQAKATSSMGM